MKFVDTLVSTFIRHDTEWRVGIWSATGIHLHSLLSQNLPMRSGEIA